VTVVRRRAIVTGRVQGVWFRAFVADAAHKARVTGFASNEPDGSVLVEVEGDEPAVYEVLERCRTGPPHARVADLRIDEVTPTGSTRFEVR
jgi:acylphosphatase